jgi:hypothetical protein
MVPGRSRSPLGLHEGRCATSVPAIAPGNGGSVGCYEVTGRALQEEIIMSEFGSTAIEIHWLLCTFCRYPFKKNLQKKLFRAKIPRILFQLD